MDGIDQNEEPVRLGNLKLIGKRIFKTVNVRSQMSEQMKESENNPIKETNHAS